MSILLYGSIIIVLVIIAFPIGVVMDNPFLEEVFMFAFMAAMVAFGVWFFLFIMLQ